MLSKPLEFLFFSRLKYNEFEFKALHISVELLEIHVQFFSNFFGNIC